MEKEYISVSDLNQKIHKHIGNNFINLKVKGEISKPYLSKSGHYYFDLKDENSKIKCTLFKNYAFRTIKPKEGVEVIVKGKVTVYKRDGTYNIQVIKIQKGGTGNLYLQYLKLKEKLKKEGLFDPKHKKQLPPVPKKIGVITAEGGAVIHDIITTVKRRWPFTEILLFPSKVQGNDAPEELIKQLKKSDKFNLDTIIIGRGGGSVEDLWCFNDEKLAREVFKLKTPIISAVGHESDFTIIEEVADKRAATPTAAAELAVPDITEKLDKLESLKKRIKRTLEYKLNECRHDYDNICRNRLLNNPKLIYKEKLDSFENLTYKLQYNSKQILSKRENKFKELKNTLKYLSSNLEDSKINRLNNIINRLEFNSRNLIIKKEKELIQITKTLEYKSNELMKTSENQLNRFKNSYILKNPQKIIKNKQEELDKNKEKLVLLNPRKTLKRGYTLTKHDNKVILSSKQLKKGDKIEIEFDDGSINAKVI